GPTYANFQFQVKDNGLTANLGKDLDSSPNTITFNITSVNDAPRGADRTISVAQNGTFTFDSSSFGFSDPFDSPANSLLSVTITSLPAQGTLKLGTNNVTAGQVIPVASLGSLTFTTATGQTTNTSFN